MATKIELEERSIEMLYDLGLRGDDLIFMLEMVKYESSWITKARALKEKANDWAETEEKSKEKVGPTQVEDSNGLWQINFNVKNANPPDYRALPPTQENGGLGYANKTEAIKALTDIDDPNFWNANQAALALVLSDQLLRLGPEKIFNPWLNSKKDVITDRGTNNRSPETIRYENLADKILPEDWYESDPNFNILRYNNFSNPANIGFRKSKVAAFQKYMVDYKDPDFVIDGRTGPATDAAVLEFQNENNLVADEQIGDEVLETIADIEVDQQINEDVMAGNLPPERTSYFSNTNLDGRPMSVSSTDVNENVVYNEELDRYEPVSFTEDGLTPRDTFDPEPFADQREQDQPIIDRNQSITDATENAKRNNPKLHFYRWLRGRSDATIDGINIIDIIEADESGFEIGTDQYDEWVESLVSQTEFYRNHADIYVENASEWYAGGLDEGWTKRRKDLVSSYVQSINNLSGKLNLNLDDDEILELAKVAWFNGFDVQELQDYVAEAENVSFGEGAIAGGSISDTRSDVKNLYRKYLMVPNEILLEESSKKIFRGTTTIDFIEDELRQQAADVYPVFADRILAGRSPLQILSGYDSIFSSVTGIQPQWDGEQKDVGIKLASGAKLANGDDVNSGNLAEWLRTDTSVGYDAMPKAINNAYSLVKGLGQTFGAVA